MALAQKKETYSTLEAALASFKSTCPAVTKIMAEALQSGKSVLITPSERGCETTTHLVQEVQPKAKVRR